MSKKHWKLLLTVVLVVVLAMALSFSALAADDPTDPGVAATKEITVLENGTYVLDLEAYATGTVTTTTEVKPCDLVPVLDASSSMGQTGSNYLMADGSVRIQALVDAVNAFLATVAEKNAENAAAGADLSRVAIVVFSDSSNTGTLYNFTEITSANLVANSVYATYSGRTYQTTGYGTSGKGFGLHNYTWTDSGLSQANTLLQTLMNTQGYNAAARNRVVVMFTDGYPNHSGGLDNFDTAAARDVITTAGTIKSSRQASLFTIAVIGDVAQPGRNPQSTSQQTYGGQSQMRMNQMLHAASSNYPLASVSGTWNVNWGTGGNFEAGFYKSATTAADLKNIFEDIASSSASTETPLTAESIMKDIVSSSFTLPAGANVNTIDVRIIPWDTTNHTWAGYWNSETNAWAGTAYTPAQWATACSSYGAEAAENVAVSLSTDGKTIDVTGFDYGTHFLATTDPTQDALNANSAKVHIRFPIQAKPSAVTGGYVATNGPESGIYIDGNATKPLIQFPQPEVIFYPITYVVDYVTSDTSHDTKASSIKLDYSSVLKNVQMLDDPSDDYLIGEEADAFNYTIYKGRYGTISFGDDEVDVQRRYVRYAPTTMNWDGYDRIFVKGESATESNLDVWAMLCVIPANSVFYEDTYISQTKTVTYAGQQIEIVYTGINYDSSWATVGTEGTNQTQYIGENTPMGWIEDLIDDDTFANDMAHVTNTAKAKATFTFSGTGMDIYSRTNGGTGTVSVTIKSLAADNESGKKITKTKILDCKAAAGDFFAIPVCTFTDLPYGKYTVTITVTTAGQSEGRTTFYLDGIRVYNPVKPLEEDENIVAGYGPDNQGAVFTEVRGLLYDDPAAATAAALYLDEHYNSDIVESVEAIRAAAEALADAQQDRDDYINGTITPAKNAVSNEEYALSSAQAALTSATNVYNTTVTAYEQAREAYVTAIRLAVAEDSNYTDLVAAIDAETPGTDAYNSALNALIAAFENDSSYSGVDMPEKADYATKLATMNAKKTEMDTAQAALTDAQNHYDANIDQLNADLAAANAGKAPYDAAVDAARAAYAAAAGVDAETGKPILELEATTTDIQMYKKEGPKSEVLLDKNQSVAITVQSGFIYYIGLRSLNGEEVTAQINGQSVTLKHTVDMYYKVPTSGTTITIKNVSDGVLSVTKLRTTNGTSSTQNTLNGIRFAPVEETLAFVRSMAGMAAAPYTDEILTEEEAVAVEEPATETPAEEPAEEPAAEEPAEEPAAEEPAEEPAAEEPAAEEPAEEPAAEEPEEESVILDEIDIVIENPEPTETEPAAEEPAETEPAETAPVDNGMSKILSSFFNFFRRR